MHPTTFSEGLQDPEDFLDRTYREENISSGSFGSVSKARAADKQRSFVAVKRLTRGFEDDRLIQLYLREIEIQLRLNHPGFTIFRGFYVPTRGKGDEQLPMLFTDYMRNGSLVDYIDDDSDRPLSQTNRAIVIYGLAVLIEYMHSHEIVHRDIKPENILLTDEWEPRLTDFGYARTVDMTGMSVNAGTPLYQAPEVVSGDQPEDMLQYGLGADMFSFGLVIWELLTRVLPYVRDIGEGMDGMAALQRMKEDGQLPTSDYQFPDNSPVFAVIKKCLSDPSERPNASKLRKEMDKWTAKDYGDWEGQEVDEKTYNDFVGKMRAAFKLTQ